MDMAVRQFDSVSQCSGATEPFDRQLGEQGALAEAVRLAGEWKQRKRDLGIEGERGNAVYITGSPSRKEVVLLSPDPDEEEEEEEEEEVAEPSHSEALPSPSGYPDPGAQSGDTSDKQVIHIDARTPTKSSNLGTSTRAKQSTQQVESPGTQGANLSWSEDMLLLSELSERASLRYGGCDIIDDADSAPHRVIGKVHVGSKAHVRPSPLVRPSTRYKQDLVPCSPVAVDRVTQTTAPSDTPLQVQQSPSESQAESLLPPTPLQPPSSDHMLQTTPLPRRCSDTVHRLPISTPPAPARTPPAHTPQAHASSAHAPPTYFRSSANHMSAPHAVTPEPLSEGELKRLARAVVGSNHLSPPPQRSGHGRRHPATSCPACRAVIVLKNRTANRYCTYCGHRL